MLELNENLLAEIGGWAALKEARGLVERGRVRDVVRDGAVVRARVQGAERAHEAQITLAERVAKVEVRCTCAEFRRTGRVCPHVLAVGLAWKREGPPIGTSAATTDERRLPLRTSAATAVVRRLPRWLVEEAPAGTVRLEITVLLPLQFSEAVGRDPVRIILEARRGDGAEAMPFDAAMRGLEKGFAVGEEDERVLAALEQLAGGAQGINAVPRVGLAHFLRALDGHPRVWLGKKQRVEVWAATERTRIILRRGAKGELELEWDGSKEVTDGRGLPSLPGRGATDGRGLPSLPGRGATDGRGLPSLPNWRFDGARIVELPAAPAGLAGGSRTIPFAQIPDFLARELPALERTCELVFAPGFEEFRLEIGQPTFEASLEGALPGLTLELVAHYDGAEFPLNGKTESSAFQKYVADPTQASRFWRRNVLAERAALAEVEAAGFKLMRSGAGMFSLISENLVARFLANSLPRWRRMWTVRFGSRLEATMAEIDMAQPEFSLREERSAGSGEDWLSLDLKLSVGGQPVALEQSEIQRWLQTGQSHARTANRRVLLVPTEAWGEMQEVLADCEVEQEPGKIRVARRCVPYLAGALEAQGFRVGVNVAADVPAPDVRGGVDEKLWKQLRPYQAQGVEWLAGLAQRNFHGLLGDDMGLGKTLQALAFCAWLKGRDGSPLPSLARIVTDAKGVASLPGTGAARDVRGVASLPGTGAARDASGVASLPGTGAATDASGVASLPVLVVCPTSLVTNWLREAARFTPHLRALDVTGPDRAEKFARRGEYDLLVTSYAILRRDVELYRGDEFLAVILDEAQHIKNRASQNAQGAKALRARHRLILTGTPLENSVLDLWSLYDFLLPGYLGTAADFKERYEGPLTQGAAPDAKVMERLRQRVRPFFLRRTKEEVLTELPPKLEFATLCELSDEQREVYRAVLAQGRREVFEESGKAGRRSGRDRMAVLTTLLRLRQVCCHLDLLPGEEGGSGKEEGRSKKAEETDSALHPSLSRWQEPSAKMERAFELIDEAMDGGHRVLLFSQFVRVLHLLREEATRRGVRFCYLDGQTVERQAEVDRFQNERDIPLFFISLKAGGTGLNLTGADTVIHFDPWWNPAVEEQATSRAHRMGQARRVQAYKLIAAGTVEEKIQALQARKRELFEASLGGDEALVEKLTGEDLEELLGE